MKRKLLSLLFIGTMVLSLVAGCGETGKSADITSEAGTAAGDENAEKGTVKLDGSWPEETVKIGVEVYDTTDSNIIAYMEYLESLEDFYNVEFIFSESIASPEEELAFADSCAAAGCTGYIGVYNCTMETIVDKVTEKGMYYWGCERGLDEKYADNEYYLGGIEPVATDSSMDASKSGDYLIGYSMAEKLAEKGVRHVVFCSGGSQMGIPMFIDRLEGFKDGIKAAQERGSDIQWDPSKDDIAGWPGTDDFAAAQSNALTKDYDAVACSFSGFEIWAQPLTDAGRTDVIISGVGSVDGSLSELFEKGMISMVIYECPEIILGQAFPMIMNAVTGHADIVKGDTGYLSCDGVRWVIEDVDTYNEIYNYHEDGHYYVTAQDMASVIYEYNNKVTQEDINHFYVSKTMDACMNK